MLLVVRTARGVRVPLLGDAGSSLVCNTEQCNTLVS